MQRRQFGGTASLEWRQCRWEWKWEGEEEGSGTWCSTCWCCEEKWLRWGCVVGRPGLNRPGMISSQDVPGVCCIISFAGTIHIASVVAAPVEPSLTKAVLVCLCCCWRLRNFLSLSSNGSVNLQRPAVTSRHIVFVANMLSIFTHQTIGLSCDMYLHPSACSSRRPLHVIT